MPSERFFAFIMSKKPAYCSKNWVFSVEMRTKYRKISSESQGGVRGGSRGEATVRFYGGGGSAFPGGPERSRDARPCRGRRGRRRRARGTRPSGGRAGRP